MEVNQIFTPGSLPIYTYYNRANLNLERKLLEAIETKGFICSVSGPSKSGKTVLCESVVGKRSMLLITGGGITTEFLFWQRLRSRLNMPNSRSDSKTSARATEIQPQIKANVQVPFFAKGEGSIGGKIGTNIGKAETASYDGPDSLTILEHLRDQAITLVIDDFHYIERAVQKSLAEQFKEAARAGNSIIVISVSHRSDDAIRANPDLRGRVVCIDIPYWKPDELRIIPLKGLPLLNVSADDAVIEDLVRESISSPQLMQAICLQLCRDLGIETTLRARANISLGQNQLYDLCRNTTVIANCKAAFDIIIKGPKTRGSERREFSLGGNKKGDIYYIILKAIASGEPHLTLPYTIIKDRVEQLVPNDNLRGSSIAVALSHMHKAVLNKLGEDRVMEWDEERGTLNIPDPYFLYYLRWAEW